MVDVELIHQKQQSKLRIQLLLTKDTDHAVVSHVRGRDGDNMRSYYKLQEAWWRIYKPYFPALIRFIFIVSLGHVRTMSSFINSKFPVAKVGFTHLVSSPEVQELARIMRLEHLLLESDTPFLTVL